MQGAGKARGFWPLIGLSIVTLGIYGIWYWFRVIRECEESFSYTEDEFQPHALRMNFIIATAVNIFWLATIIVWGVMTEGVPFESPAYWAFAVVTSIPTVFFFVRLPRFLEAAQIKAHVEIPLEVGGLRTLYCIGLGLSFLPQGIGAVGSVLLVIWVYKIVTQINRIWNEGVFSWWDPPHAGWRREEEVSPAAPWQSPAAVWQPSAGAYQPTEDAPAVPAR